MSGEISLRIVFIGAVGVGKKAIINLILDLKSLPFPPGKSPESVIKKGNFVSNTINQEAMLISSTPDLVKSGKHNSFLQNAKLYVFVVTEFRDMVACKQLMATLSELSPEAQFCAIANKQDTEKSLNPNAAMKFFELPTIGISAIMPEHKEALTNFLSEFL
ncbi:MAG: hypothetical protein ACTSRG_07300 [Candidatus Helarchaeota archaeon]